MHAYPDFHLQLQQSCIKQMRKIIDKIGLVYLIMATRYNALTDIIYPIGANIKHKISRRLRCQNYILCMKQESTPIQS